MLKELEKYQQKDLEEKKDFERRISELKSGYIKQIRAISINEKNRRKLLQKQFNEQTRKDRKRFNQDLRQIKRKYQLQAEQVRTLYNDQNVKLHEALTAEHSNKLSELMKKYEELAFSATQKFEMIKANLDELQSHLNKVPAPVQTSSLEKTSLQQESAINADKTEDLQEKMLEIERLQKIKQIGEMIKEIAQKRETRSEVG
jgi:hypothetical protein